MVPDRESKKLYTIFSILCKPLFRFFISPCLFFKFYPKDLQHILRSLSDGGSVLDQPVAAAA